MITVIRNAHVFTPESIGKKDVAFAGNQILAIEEHIEFTGTSEIKYIDANGKKLIPGLIDSLVHISGGGGEGGFSTRTPAMHLTDATRAGITTVVGALGTDDVSRSLEDLLAKAYGLEEEGLSAYIYTGSYQVPVPTITGSIRKDISLIPNIIGVGELALSDHRGSHPSAAELTRIAADSRVAGMLAGKKGVVFLHLGDHEQKLELVHQVIQNSAIPASQFYATHINRHYELLQDGAKLAGYGGFIDMTTSTLPEFIEQGEVPAAQAVAKALELGAPLEQISMSSDGNASLPVFNDEGELTGLQMGQLKSLFDSFVELSQLISFEQALSTVTSNPANALGLKRKGQISENHDVDLVLLNQRGEIDSVWAKGQLMVSEGKVQRLGQFEPSN